MIKLILLSSCLTVGGSLHAASGLIDWGNAANQTPFGDATYVITQDGNAAPSDSTGFDTVLNPMDSQNGILQGSQAAIATSGVVVTKPVGAGAAMKMQLDQSTSDNWGVDLSGSTGGPAGQTFGNSGLFFFTEGGPWLQSDGSITTTINFGAYTGGGVANLEFGMFGINRQYGSGGMAATLDGSDIVSVSATDITGAAIDISSFFTTASTLGTGTAAFDMSGTTTVVLDASAQTPIQAVNSDHGRSDTNATFDAGSQMIQTLTIKYEATSAGSNVSESSSGFVVSDIAFQTVPEPSSFLLSFAGLAGLAFYRKRKA